MANLDFLEDIHWDVTNEPESARITWNFTRLSDTDLQRFVLPGRPFTIEFPASRYGSNKIIEEFDPEGIPVTVEDLLNTIYNVYQQPITPADVANLQADVMDAEYLDGALIIGDLLGGLVDFAGLGLIGPDYYVLGLEA